MLNKNLELGNMTKITQPFFLDDLVRKWLPCLKPSPALGQPFSCNLLQNLLIWGLAGDYAAEYAGDLAGDSAGDSVGYLEGD